LAELADAHGSGPCASNGLGVQVSQGAPPKKGTTITDSCTFSLIKLILFLFRLSKIICVSFLMINFL